MLVIDQTVNRDSITLDLVSFITEYDYPLVLQWVIAHSNCFSNEIIKILKDIQNELKCVYKADIQLESVSKNVICVSYVKKDTNSKVFKINFLNHFKKHFLQFLEQCAQNVVYLQKTIICKNCNGLYTLLATKLCMTEDGCCIVCPICGFETNVNISLDTNPLLHISTIYESLV